MGTRTCSVPECGRRHRCKGLCGLHYSRLLAKGSVSAPPQRPTECSVDDCGDRPVARGWCRKHYYRWKRTGSLADPTPRTDITYTGAHDRVVSAKGSASGYACVGCAQPADEWSYNREDPAARVDDLGRPYSLDPAFYRPRCRRCHRRADAPARATCAVGGCGRLVKARSLCSKHYQRKSLRASHELMRPLRSAA